MNASPWYSVVSLNDGLHQGDLIEKCPIIIPPSRISDGGKFDVDVKIADAIILSQSCDLENRNIDIVLVCPYYKFEEFAIKSEKTAREKKINLFNSLAKGQQHAYHLLGKEDNNGLLNDFLVVDFRNVYGVNVDFLNTHIQQFDARLRLLSPYREHLSQSFARFFMRVGLPSNLRYE